MGYYSSMVFLIPAILLAMYAQVKVQSTFSRYLRHRSLKGYTGSQVARSILDSQGLHNVNIELVGGRLSDHYDPRTNVLRLSRDVYSGTSIAALGVAAHETGHAIQHNTGYFPLLFRNSLVPVANLGSQLAWVFILMGFLIHPRFINIGIILFSAAVLFQVVTLPVEFNASRRAIYLLSSGGYVTQDEVGKAKKVLSAAALTYVAATAVALAQLLRLMTLRNRD
ncbi:MAG: zinc metallopeptidase [Clostridia bacterium]|nr:zinc metallopeptidase [Clostridia bacterium]